MIEYTPAHFKDIYCVIETGFEEGQRAIFYAIGCPQYPNEATTNSSKRLHDIAFNLIDFWESHGEEFPGFKLVTKQKQDGTWEALMEFLEYDYARGDDGQLVKKHKCTKRKKIIRF